MMIGDVIIGVGSVSFWTERSLKKSEVMDVIRTATDVLNVKVAATSTQRILLERQDSSSTLDTARQHTVTCEFFRLPI